MFKKELKEKGFTLIEMMIVLFIIGTIISIALPNFLASGEKAQVEADLANKMIIKAQLESYYLEHNNQYPTDLNVLVTEKYLEKIPDCPTGGTYTFSVSEVDNKVTVTCN